MVHLIDEPFSNQRFVLYHITAPVISEINPANSNEIASVDFKDAS